MEINLSCDLKFVKRRLQLHNKMRTLAVILFLCFVQISIFIRSTESQYFGFGSGFGTGFGAGFGASFGTGFGNGFGYQQGNGPSVPNGSGGSSGVFSGVSQDLIMGQNCEIGSYCTISTGCSMGDNVRVGNYVQMNQGVSIGNNVDIGSGCFMGMMANVGPYTKFEQNVYTGDHCHIGSNAMIGENSIIQPFAMVPDNGHVGSNEMVIKTPTTSQLYGNSLPMDQIPQPDVHLADQGQPEDLNERVRQLMSSQTQKLSSNCDGNAQSVDFKPLGLVISLYLIRYDGLDRFVQNMGQGNGAGGVFSLGNFGIGDVYINGMSVFGSPQTVGNEQHFVQGSPKKFLEPELENGMVELLALKEDSQRSNRAPGDTFCKTVAEVQNKQKKVKCDRAVDVGSASKNGPQTENGNPQTPNQGSGNRNPLNSSPSNNPNRGNQQPLQPSYQPNPNKGNQQQFQSQQPSQPQQPSQSQRPYQTQQPSQSQQPYQSQQPNQGQNTNQPSNEENDQNPRPNYSMHNNLPKNSNNIPLTPPVTEENDSQHSNPAPTPSYSNNHPAQGTNQPTPGYPSNSHPPKNPLPNDREPVRTSNPNRPPSTSHNSQPNQNRPPSQPHSGNSPSCNRCNIQPDTSFGDNIELGNNLNIGKGTTIGNNCKIKDSANVGDGVMIGSGSVVSENANIGSNCVLDDNSKIGANANVRPGSYVGKNCNVGANAFVGENSIVLDNAKVPNGGQVGSNDVVMQTPTSADLYSSCAPIERVPQSLISQPDPNNNLRQMMRGQIAKVRSHCQQQSQQLLDFAALASAKTIYLLSLHGIPNFTENLQNVMNQASGNGNYNAKYEQLMNEEHFVDNGQPSRIEPDVKGEMIVLMAIEQDFGRGNRSPGDSFCQTFMEIASNQRQVKCDK